ncbi:MAG: hypothetical protein U9R42_08025 [Bacteroidota bacterium]|nr:hypothetical protein [Bacteroidota bacterium]
MVQYNELPVYKVSEVRYKSNLTEIKPIIPKELKIGGQLYDAL